jgi:hypothetical protein
MIVPGKPSDVVWGKGNWIILDIGFSGRSDNRGRTCGLIIGKDDPTHLSFADAKRAVVSAICGSQSEINLMIEAPLSVSFRNGLPATRLVEREGSQSRSWFTGAGCAVMVASMYLLREISQSEPAVTVRLFEGFVSFKDRAQKSDHKYDAKLLKEALQYPERYSGSIISENDLKEQTNDDLMSAFSVMGLDYGVPVVVKRFVMPEEVSAAAQS